MSFSLGYRTTESKELTDAVLLACGKSLYIANAFEEKCRYILRLANLISATETHRGANLHDIFDYLPKDKLLAQTIASLKIHKHWVWDSNYDGIIEKARDARNYIAHEGAAIGVAYRTHPHFLSKRTQNLRLKVTDLAHGDNLFSQWVYEIEEKEPPPPQLCAEYPTIIDKWIFGDLDVLYSKVDLSRPKGGVEALKKRLKVIK